MKNKKVWNRTKFTWGFGTHGAIGKWGMCFIDLVLKEGEKHTRYHFSNIWAESTPDFHSVILFDISSEDHRSPGLEIITKIRETLAQAFPDPRVRLVCGTGRFNGRFQIIFPLKDSFCDQTLEFTRLLMKTLGVSDVDLRLGTFSVQTETFYRVPGSEDEYMPFSEYLKMKHKLLCNRDSHHAKCSTHYYSLT